MGDGTKENPFTREDVEARIKESGETAERLDLSGKHFQEGINLYGLNLKRADLGGAHLEGAGAHIEGARFSLWGTAHLEEAYLESAHLEGARLEGAHLEGADLEDAHLEGADLGNAHLERAHLGDANLVEAYLGDANLEGAHLESANLEGAYLESVNLEGAYLGGTHLEGAYLGDAKFSPETRLEEADWGNFILGEEINLQFDTAADTYRRLKTWHTNAGYSDIAAKFHYREIEARRKGAGCWKDRAAGWLSWAVFGHGEGWKRLLFWVVGFILLFALTYYAIGSVWQWSAFWKSLYFSAVSFTALGYGSWLHVTNNWIKGIGAFESFIGVFSIALLLVTFVRKWTR